MTRKMKEKKNEEMMRSVLRGVWHLEDRKVERSDQDRSKGRVEEFEMGCY